MQAIWRAEDILSAVRGSSLHAQDWTAQGVSIDTRTLRAGDLFIALEGPSMDGHDFVQAAFEKGAAAALVSRQPPKAATDKPLIFTEDTMTALQELGLAGRARARAKILAVTGSVGKTSTKDMLRLMLGTAHDVYASEGSLNNQWGVPLSLARLPQDAAFGVFEVGMNHTGELGPLSRAVRPHIALITNVEDVHLAHFASSEEIADAKAEIFEGLEPQGVALLNRDNRHYARLHAAARQAGVKTILSFGADARADARLLNVTPDGDGALVQASIAGLKLGFKLGAGAHLATSAVGALLACHKAGADITLCAEALAFYRPPEGRGTRYEIELAGGGTMMLIDESFNASPIAVKAALAVLGQSAGSRKIAVLGDMRELGAAAEGLHVGLLETLVDSGIGTVHCCGELMARLHENLPGAMRGHLAASSEELIPLLSAEAKAGDVIMIKGSHSLHMEKIVAALRELAQDGNKHQTET